MIRLTLCLLCVVLLLCGGCASSDVPTDPAKSSLSANDPVHAYVELLRSDLSQGKVQTITGVMKLDAAESKVFWPIYRDYEEELFALGDQRLEWTRKYLTAQQSGKLDSALATELADGYFRYEADRTTLLKKYHAAIAKDLSPIRAAQFTQIEHRVSTIIDLLIASELPLVEPAAGSGKGT